MGKRKPTFEEALEQLETIAEQIEQGKIGLEESIAQYEKGMSLIKHCREVLTKAEHRIEGLREREDGTLTTTEFKRNETS